MQTPPPSGKSAPFAFPLLSKHIRPYRLLQRRLPDLLEQAPGRAVELCCLSLALFCVSMRPSFQARHVGIAGVLHLEISIQNLLLAAGCIAAWAVLIRTSAGSKERFNSLQHAVVSLLWTLLSCTAVAGLVLFYRSKSLYGLKDLLAFAFLSVLFLLIARVVTNVRRLLTRRLQKRPRVAVIVGAGWRGQRLHRELLQHPRWNYELLGHVDTNPPSSDLPLLCEIGGLEAFLMSHAVDEVIITLPIKSMYDDIQKTIQICERTGVQSRYFTDLFSTQITKRLSSDQHYPSSVLLHLVHDDHGYVVKRVMDVSVALLSLLSLLPLMLVVALAIRLTSPGPVLFRQQRFGLNRRLFTMYKFRTMVVDAEKLLANLEHLNETGGATFKSKQDPRVTAVGSFLRKTSLDELPQLWNVLGGSMSLVGPRPLPVRDVKRFSEAWLMRRFSVAPGITGLWQVSGRSNTSFSKWIELDLDYIDNWSLTLDLKILMRTIPAVLKGSGAV